MLMIRGLMVLLDGVWSNAAFTWSTVRIADATGGLWIGSPSKFCHECYFNTRGMRVQEAALLEQSISGGADLISSFACTTSGGWFSHELTLTVLPGLLPFIEWM